jgi:hypothetical protein
MASIALQSNLVLIQLASAEILDLDLREVSVIIERKVHGKYTDVSELKAVTSYLSCHLAKAPSNRGLLECLGYRESPNLELIFEVPNGIGRPQTLRSLIAADTRKGPGGGRPLDSRFLLACRLLEAVFSVHTAQLVHKNIRPETILVYQSISSEQTALPSDATGLELPFLTDWSMLRKADGVSSRRGENDWMKDMYRHPQRQGLQPEERYNMGP